MKKYALLLTGYSSSFGKIDLDNLVSSREMIEHSYLSFHEYILSQNNVDVFIHTWTNQNNDVYLELFKPQDYIIEDQPNFLDNAGQINLFRNPQYKQMVYAKSYAIRKVVEFVVDKGYDGILLTRPDITWFYPCILGSLDPDKFHITTFTRWFYNGKRIYPKDINLLVAEINFSKIRIEEKNKIHDLVYFSSIENITSFATLFDYLKIYLAYDNHREYISSIHYDMHFLQEKHFKNIRLDSKLVRSFKLLSQVFTTRGCINLK